MLHILLSVVIYQFKVQSLLSFWHTTACTAQLFGLNILGKFLQKLVLYRVLRGLWFLGLLTIDSIQTKINGTKTVFMRQTYASERRR